MSRSQCRTPHRFSKAAWLYCLFEFHPRHLSALRVLDNDAAAEAERTSLISPANPSRTARIATTRRCRIGQFPAFGILERRATLIEMEETDRYWRGPTRWSANKGDGAVYRLRRFMKICRIETRDTAHAVPIGNLDFSPNAGDYAVLAQALQHPVDVNRR